MTSSNTEEYILIGVAWPYANGPLHLGHIAGAILPADIFARYNRMKGRKVLMVSGTDEHGTPITIEASKRGISPKELVDKYYEIIKNELNALHISFDLFTRTSTENHKEFVKAFIKRLRDRGYIYEKEVEVPHCKSCGNYLPDRYIEGTCPYCGYEHARGDQCDNCGTLLEPKLLKNPRCRICGSQDIEFIERKHLFFALSKLQKPLEEWLLKKNWWKPNVINYTINWIKAGLRDRAITRDISWGVEVPFEGYEDRRVYVWFEALLGYISAAIEYSKKIGDESYWEKFWKNPNARIYLFLGKDNIPFHTILFPAMLIAHGNLNLPYDVPANEYLLISGEKLDKSRGIVFWVSDALKIFDADAIRYYLSVNMPETRDTSLDIDDMITKNNKELVANIGNFIHRVLHFAYYNFGSIPEPGELDNEDLEVLNEARMYFKSAEESLEKCRFREALKKITEIAHLGNKYLDMKAPWKTIKTDIERTKTTIYVALNLVKILLIGLHPFLPKSTAKGWKYLGYEKDIHEVKWEEALEEVPVGQKLLEPRPMYRVIDPNVVIPKEPWEEGEILPASVLDIRVGEVVEVSDHPNADKLYVLKVNLGSETRTLVAGLKPYYKREELEKKKIAVLANLKPAKLRGIISEGMLLAADDGKTVSILIPEGEPGDVIYFENVKRKPKSKISIDEFMKVNLYVDEKGMIRAKSSNDAILRTKSGYVKLYRPVRPGAKVR
ncbi:MAG: methionine--tRNA ligase [Euryarchaeota archaeon]|nr:methionine--tRNA ligase [Euryarchaeota archaeon]